AYPPAPAREIPLVPLAVYRDERLVVLVPGGRGGTLTLAGARDGAGRCARVCLLAPALGIEDGAVHAGQRQVVALRLVGEVDGRHRVVAHVAGEVEREHAEDHEDPEDEEERHTPLAAPAGRLTRHRGPPASRSRRRNRRRLRRGSRRLPPRRSAPP